MNFSAKLSAIAVFYVIIQCTAFAGSGHHESDEAADFFANKVSGSGCVYSSNSMNATSVDSKDYSDVKIDNCNISYVVDSTTTKQNFYIGSTDKYTYNLRDVSNIYIKVNKKSEYNDVDLYIIVFETRNGKHAISIAERSLTRIDGVESWFEHDDTINQAGIWTRDGDLAKRLQKAITVVAKSCNGLKKDTY